MTTSWQPDQEDFPRRKDLPSIPGAPAGAAWFWGKDDQLGRLNLLTPRRVAAAAASQIKTGEVINLDLPLNHPKQPAFGREPFKHTIHATVPGVCFDDTYALNTQSGTQWDGFRHFAHIETNTWYNNCKQGDVQGPHANLKDSIHYWRLHGVAGRGILLDFASWADKEGRKFDPYSYDGITYAELVAVGKSQGLDIRPEKEGGDVKIGDMLFVRTGWTRAYFSKSEEEASQLHLRHEKEFFLGGLIQETEILDWLHDCYFASVAGDSPTFERWPSKPGEFIHEHLLALWGCPLGEMLDLEQLAETCKMNKRWTFFFTSAPANMPGGIASHVNGTAIF